MQVQINDNARTIKLLDDELQIVKVNLSKQISISQRYKIELDTYIYKINQMIKDFLDLNIKNNLINQVRESTEKTNQKLLELVKKAERK